MATRKQPMIMSVAEWIDIPDNPRQRDTERHADQWRRTRDMENKQPHEDVVAAAKDGDILCKLDGHTRAFLWASGELDQPQLGCVSVTLKQVQNLAEAADMYELYDPIIAAKSINDRLFGACNENGFRLVSPLLRMYNFATALSVADAVWKTRKKIDPNAAVLRWKDELKAIDLWGIGRIPCALVAGCLLLAATEPIEYPREFFTLVASDGGTKNADGTFDGVEALCRHIETRRYQKRMSGYDNIIDVVGRVLTAYAAWKEQRTIKKYQGLRLTNPKTLIVKCMTMKGRD